MWLVLNHPKMVNFQVSYTSIPELCKSIQIRLHLWASGRLWGLLVHSSVKAGVWGSCCKLTSACPFIILHNASRVFARTCAPPLPGFGVFACCLKAGVLQNLSTERVVRVLLCWCCKLCVAWMLEIKKRRGFASKDSCIRPGSSCSHIPVLWGGSGSGELTVTCRSQIGNRCPAMVTAAATTFKFLRFSAISFPLTSYQTAAMFISRVIFQWKGRRGCNDTSLLSQPFTARWLSLCSQSLWMVNWEPWLKALSAEDHIILALRRTTGREGLTAGPGLWQRSTIPAQALGSAGLHNAFVSQGKLAVWRYLSAPTTIFQGRFFWASSHVLNNISPQPPTLPWISQSCAQSVCFSVEVSCGLCCCVQVQLVNILLGLESGTASSYEKKQLPCTEASTTAVLAQALCGQKSF